MLVRNLSCNSQNACQISNKKHADQTASSEAVLIGVCTGPHSTVIKLSDCRYVSDCRFKGREFDPGPDPYFRGD